MTVSNRVSNCSSRVSVIGYPRERWASAPMMTPSRPGATGLRLAFDLAHIPHRALGGVGGHGGVGAQGRADLAHAADRLPGVLAPGLHGCAALGDHRVRQIQG